jgi:quinol monooxygenase YgiN
MIVVTLLLKVASAKRADVITLFESFIGPVSVQPGCLSVNLYSNTSNADLLLIEEWDSHMNLERHIRSDNFRKILALMDMADEKPEITFQAVSSTKGLEFVEKLRRPETEFHEPAHREVRDKEN